MKFFISFFFFLLLVQIAQSQSTKKLHYKAILVDTHNDVLSSTVLEGKDISHRLTTGQSDLDRWKEGGLDVQFFSVWTDKTPRNKEGFFKDANQEIDSLEIIALRNPYRMTLATTYKQVKNAIRQKKLVALIGVEGGHMIEDDLSKLDSLYTRGMRYMTLTWNNSTPWATSAMDETQHPDSLKHKGLTEFGKQIIHRMNELGIIVDLSHVGEQTFYDAIATTTKPVLLSHSSVWNICPVFRNVKDEQIKAVAKNRGVICVNFFSGFLDSNFAKKMAQLEGGEGKRIKDSLGQNYDAAKLNEVWRKYFSGQLQPYRPTISQLVDHIDYIVKLVGDSYVGIGSDFDGVSSLPIGMDDVTKYPLITEELKRRGYSNKSIKKILGGNVMRVMKANFK
ncbi:MAG TPA: dipeptidase [Chitinophagaceae bacterium]|jgi:membrane dipeptidase|nr:dipeptidase [Chitinophagaceae bacterium]